MDPKSLYSTIDSCGWCHYAVSKLGSIQALMEQKSQKYSGFFPLTTLCYVVRMGEERGVYRVLVGKLEGKRPLGRPRHRWVDNIRMNLQEVGCGLDWAGPG